MMLMRMKWRTKMSSERLVKNDANAKNIKDLSIGSGQKFSPDDWLSYFQINRETRADITFPDRLSVDAEVRAPLIKSLKRFQIGETGEGRHLRKYASLMNDPVYEECIDLFVKEEQFHARVLAQIIQSLDGTLLSWHWTDLAYICLRRMLGLKTEVFIMLIAEIIGKCFYRVCADNLDNRLLSDAFSLIVLDEIGHLEFHTHFLQDRTQAFPHIVRRGVHYAWCILFVTACLVFIADHKRTLAALKVTPRDFMRDCLNTFHRTATRALHLHRPSLEIC
jgi:hypothetical protein